MTAATLHPPPSYVIPPSQNTAPVLEYRCLYTRDVKRKAKRWQDGFLRFHTFNKRVMIYDEPRNFIGDTHWTSSSDSEHVEDGDEFTLERSGILVQCTEYQGLIQTDLSGLWAHKSSKQVHDNSAPHVAQHASAQLQMRSSNGKTTAPFSRPAQSRPVLSSISGSRPPEFTRSMHQNLPPSKKPRDDENHIPLWEVLRNSRAAKPQGPQRPSVTQSSPRHVGATLNATTSSSRPDRPTYNPEQSPRRRENRIKARDVVDLTTGAARRSTHVEDTNNSANASAIASRRKKPVKASEMPPRVPRSELHPADDCSAAVRSPQKNAAKNARSSPRANAAECERPSKCAKLSDNDPAVAQPSGARPPQVASPCSVRTSRQMSAADESAAAGSACQDPLMLGEMQTNVDESNHRELQPLRIRKRDRRPMLMCQMNLAPAAMPEVENRAHRRKKRRNSNAALISPDEAATRSDAVVPCREEVPPPYIVVEDDEDRLRLTIAAPEHASPDLDNATTVTKRRSPPLEHVRSIVRPGERQEPTPIDEIGGEPAMADNSRADDETIEELEKADSESQQPVNTSGNPRVPAPAPAPAPCDHADEADMESQHEVNISVSEGASETEMPRESTPVAIVSNRLQCPATEQRSTEASKPAEPATQREAEATSNDIAVFIREDDAHGPPRDHTPPLVEQGESATESVTVVEPSIVAAAAQSAPPTSINKPFKPLQVKPKPSAPAPIPRSDLRDATSDPINLPLGGGGPTSGAWTCEAWDLFGCRPPARRAQRAGAEPVCWNYTSRA